MALWLHIIPATSDAYLHICCPFEDIANVFFRVFHSASSFINQDFDFNQSCRFIAF